MVIIHYHPALDKMVRKLNGKIGFCGRMTYGVVRPAPNLGMPSQSRSKGLAQAGTAEDLAQSYPRQESARPTYMQQSLSMRMKMAELSRVRKQRWFGVSAIEMSSPIGPRARTAAS